MGYNTKITWTDATLNPYRGTKGTYRCTKVSEGCRHCYAEAMNKRGLHGGITNFTADADSLRYDDIIARKAYAWTTPRMVFVNSMSDTFHEEATVEILAKLFAVMEIASWHTYQVLTKRPERMRTVLGSLDFWFAVSAAMKREKDWIKEHLSQRRANQLAERSCDPSALWPKLHIWIGTTCENQDRFNERISVLLDTPASCRFVSFEPLLGRVDASRAFGPQRMRLGVKAASYDRGIDWIIIGGESGPHARLFGIEWAYELIEQAKKWNVPVFFKQLGAKPFQRITLMHPKGADPKEWPSNLQVQQWPDLQPDLFKR